MILFYIIFYNTLLTKINRINILLNKANFVKKNTKWQENCLNIVININKSTFIPNLNLFGPIKETIFEAFGFYHSVN